MLEAAAASSGIIDDEDDFEPEPAKRGPSASGAPPRRSSGAQLDHSSRARDVPTPNRGASRGWGRSHRGGQEQG